MVVQEPVQSAIWQCLNNYNYADAVFLSERLYAEVGSDEALYLLATCYYRSGKPQRAYSLLTAHGFPTSQCRYLAAQCCLQLNRLAEAEAAITAGRAAHKHRNVLDEIVAEFGDSASFALRLLANVYWRSDNIARATECFQRSVQLNPFLWSSYESLCLIGEKPDVSRIFQVNSQMLTSVCQTHVYMTPSQMTPHVGTDAMDSQDEPSSLASSIYIDPTMTCDPTPINIPPTVTVDSDTTQPAVRWRTCISRPMSLSPLTPSFGVMPLEVTPSPGAPPSSALNSVNSHMCTSPAVSAQLKTRRFQPSVNAKPVFSQSGNTNTVKDSLSTNQTTAPLASHVGGGLRRSSRLFSHTTNSSVKENSKDPGDIGKLVLSPRAPTKKTKSKQAPMGTAHLNDKNKSDLTTAGVVASQSQQMALLQRQSADGLMQLLQDIATAYQSLTQFECQRAIELFSALPARHYNTGWVLCQVARAYFELCDYPQAERIFSELRRLEPQCIEGLDIYSTVLWHLQSEVALSALAQDVTEFDKLSPQTWCVVGNCFSLQKEHDVAVRYFQRAIQVDPLFAYAYTLLGHEYVLIDEFDKALAAFRNALRLDVRHYNAWYGIGMVYYKQEKFVLAEFHFKKALTINPFNSSLLCTNAVVQHALKRSSEAITTLDRAITIDSRNALCKFHRASILFATDRHREALQELEEVKNIVPKESAVYFLMAKVHKKLGNTHLALINFSWATDLDPKGTNNHIKEALDKRYMVDDDEADDNSSNLSVMEPEPVNESVVDAVDSSLMEADFQLRAVESDESL